VVISFCIHTISLGDEIYDPKKIARDYLKQRFWVDLLATIPFDYMTEGNKQLKFL